MVTMSCVRFGLAALLMVLLPTGARSQQGPESGTAALGEIVISSRRPIAEAVATVRTRDTSDFRALGARTLDQALELLPGLRTQLAAVGGVRIDVRGYRSRHVQLLFDGVPVNSAYDGQFDPTTIPVELIDRVKLTTGVPSVLYGQGGLGGVINVVTRQGTVKPSASAFVESRSGDGLLLRGTASGTWHGIDAFAAASHLGQDAFPSWNGSPTLGSVASATRTNADLRRQSVFGSVGTTVSGWRWGLTGNWTGARGGVPPSIIDAAADSFAQRPRFERLDDSDGGRAQLATSGMLFNALPVRAWTFRNWIRETTSRFADAQFTPGTVPGSPGTARTTGDGATDGTTIQLRAHVGGEVTIALGTERDAWDGTAIQTSGGGGNRPPRTDTTAIDAKLTRYRAALEYQAPAVGGVAAVAGVLTEWQRGTGTSASGTGLTFGARYDLSPRMHVRASAGRLFRFPSARQLFDADAGNTSLAPEASNRMEVGLEAMAVNGMGVSVVGFVDHARNFIQRASAMEPFTNRERSRFRGVEVEGTWLRGPRLLRLGYSWLDAVDRSPGNAGARLAYRPRHHLTGEARHAWTSGFSAAVSARFVAGVTYDSRLGPTRSRPLPDYSVVGLRVSQAIAAHHVTLHVGADNLLNAAFEDAYGFPQSGRRLYVGLETRR